MIFEQLLANNGPQRLQKLTWGYSACENRIIDVDLVEVEKRQAFRKKYGATCLEDSKIKELRSVASFGATLNDFGTKETRGKLAFLYANPTCLIKSHYIKWCEQFLCDVSLAISLFNKEACDVSLATFIKPEECKISLDGIKSTVDKLCLLEINTVVQEKGCEIAAEVFIIQNYCDLETGIKIEESVCELAYTAFINQCNCNITLPQFKAATSRFTKC